MKNKLLSLGLSLILSGGILCNYSFAGVGYNCIRDDGHRRHNITWSTPSESTLGKDVSYAYCTCSTRTGRGGYLSCSYSSTYDYHNPSISVFSLSNPADLTHKPSIKIFEEGTQIPSSLINITASNEDEEAPYPDSNPRITYSIDGTPISLDSSTYTLNTSSFAIGEHRLKVTAKDNFNAGTNAVSKEVPFYIGPYPTVSFNAYSSDNNVTTSNYTDHRDTVTVDNIKLISTYKPTDLTLYLYEGSTLIKETTTTPVDSNEYKITNSEGNEITIGYITNFEKANLITDNTINPLNNPYIMVKVGDGRSGTNNHPTDPTIAKFAKYLNPLPTL